MKKTTRYSVVSYRVGVAVAAVGSDASAQASDWLAEVVVAVESCSDWPALVVWAELVAAVAGSVYWAELVAMGCGWVSFVQVYDR